MQHPRQADVHRVLDPAGGPCRAVESRGLAADDGQVCVGGPRLEVVLLVDECPDLLDAALHLAGAAYEPRHQPCASAARRIARSIFG